MFAEGVQYAAAELHRRSSEPERALDDKVRADALDEAASRLTQDRPGPSTLDYQQARHDQHTPQMGAVGSAQADLPEERAPDPFARHETTVEDREEVASEEVVLEHELAIEGGRL
jgi:hypothetical protein